MTSPDEPLRERPRVLFGPARDVFSVALNDVQDSHQATDSIASSNENRASTAMISFKRR